MYENKEARSIRIRFNCVTVAEYQNVLSSSLFTCNGEGEGFTYVLLSEIIERSLVMGNFLIRLTYILLHIPDTLLFLFIKPKQSTYCVFVCFWHSTTAVSKQCVFRWERATPPRRRQRFTIGRCNLLVNFMNVFPPPVACFTFPSLAFLFHSFYYQTDDKCYGRCFSPFCRLLTFHKLTQ